MVKTKVLDKSVLRAGKLRSDSSSNSKLTCKGEVCFDADGNIVVDFSKSAADCPVDFRDKLMEKYKEGGQVTFKMPLSKQSK